MAAFTIRSDTATPKKKYTKFPERVYVAVEHENDGDWLNVMEDATRAEDGKVAVYKLVKVVTKSTRVEFDAPLE